MPDGKEGKALVVFHLEGLMERSDEAFQLPVVMVETEREHQGGCLDDVCVDVELIAGCEDDLQVMFVHERVVAG